MDLPLSESGTLLADVPCAKCGYSLRTKQPAEKCPECGHGVQESMDAARYIKAPPRWLGWQVAAGWSLIGINAITTTTFTIGWGSDFLSPHSFPHNLVAALMQILLIIAPTWPLVLILGGMPATHWSRGLSWLCLAGMVFTLIQRDQDLVFSTTNFLMPCILMAAWIRNLQPQLQPNWSLRANFVWAWVQLGLASAFTVYCHFRSLHVSNQATIFDWLPIAVWVGMIAGCVLGIALLRHLIRQRPLSLAYHAAHRSLPAPLKIGSAVWGCVLTMAVLIFEFAVVIVIWTQASKMQKWISEGAWNLLVPISMTCLLLFSLTLAIRAFRFGYKWMP